MKKPILPTIHLNGTSRKTLQESYDAVDQALHELTEAWGRVEFNARDYYVQGPEAFQAAQNERWAMAMKIQELKEYVDAIRGHLYSA